MATNLLEAANNVQTLRRQFQAVLDIADAVQNVGDLDRATNEAELRLTEKRTEEAGVDARIKLATDAEEQVEQKAADIDQLLADKTAEVNVNATNIIADARAQAEGIEAEARRQADKIIADANTSAAGIDDSIKAKRDELAGVQHQVDDKAAEYQALQDKIDAAKAEISKILGG